MYLGSDMSPADPGESNGYTLDWINDIPDGQTIVSIDSVSLTVRDGTDPDPSSHLIGPAILIPDTQGYQVIRGLLAGNVYTLQMMGVTSGGLQVSIWTHIPCEEVY